MLDLNYFYVVFNGHDGPIWKDSPNGYNSICTLDLNNYPEDIEVVSAPLYYLPRIIRFIFGLHISERVNRLIRLPFQSIWYPLYFKSKRRLSKPICFVFISKLDTRYMAYLKKKYPKSKTVVLLRDIIATKPDFMQVFKEHCDLYDIWMSFDKQESQNYSMHSFDEFESKIAVPIAKDYPLSDVYFAGQAKDRFPRLLKAYDIFTKAGLKCSYYLTGVPENERINLPNVIYSDKFMEYSQMLYYTVNSRCVLEINQEQAVGYTSRFLEAVMFNKRLITDNASVKETPFYNPANIQIVSDIAKIDPNFINNTEVVDYHYTDEFSPIHLITQIDGLLHSNE